MKKKCLRICCCLFLYSQNNSLKASPAGLLQTLPLLHYPWSDIFLGVVTSPPPSDGNTSALTMVSFLKMAKIILLLKVPLARETAE